MVTNAIWFWTRPETSERTGILEMDFMILCTFRKLYLLFPYLVFETSILQKVYHLVRTSIRAFVNGTVHFEELFHKTNFKSGSLSWMIHGSKLEIS